LTPPTQPGKVQTSLKADQEISSPTSFHNIVKPAQGGGS